MGDLQEPKKGPRGVQDILITIASERRGTCLLVGVLSEALQRGDRALCGHLQEAVRLAPARPPQARLRTASGPPQNRLRPASEPARRRGAQSGEEEEARIGPPPPAY
jgi:hypothetical protein